MDRHASAPGGQGACSVLVLGMDRADESSLLRRLTSLAGAHVVFSATNDFEQCTLLVAHRDSTMLRVASKIAAERPRLAFLVIDADGNLHDGRHDGGQALDDPGVRRALSPTTEPSTVSRIDTSPPPLARQLRDRIAAASGHATLALDGRQVLLIDFDRRIALPVDMHGDAIAASLAASFPRLRLHALPADDFSAALPTTPPLPIAPLLWNIALQVSWPDALLPPLSPDSVLSLRQWPDFRTLAHRHDHFRLCCLLLKRASTPQEAAHLLSLDRSVVDSFYSAAYISGYAEIVDTPVRHDVPAVRDEDRKSPGSALARMWRSVRQAVGS